MFKVTNEPTFTHDVTARVPVDGGFEDQRFKATFRVIDTEEADTFTLTTVEGQRGFLRRVVVTLSDLADAEGKPIEFNAAVFDAVLKLPWACAALARAYFLGVSGAKAGN